ncbi:MAG TPA: cell division protein CrgA [Candidatus Luteococcus avicola]|nr:cell division protein CrgA [Candidatus Luteococcus avicola]
MPESKPRKEAAEKRKDIKAHELEDQRAAVARKSLPKNRSWVPWVFIPVGLLGVIWLVLYYIAGTDIPGMRDLGNWNIAIGMGLMAASFGLATLWT